jgi:hypothetical protein
MKYPKLNWTAIEKAARGLSQAEIARAANEAVKNAILHQSSEITTHELTSKLSERQAMRAAFSTAR